MRYLLIAVAVITCGMSFTSEVSAQNGRWQEKISRFSLIRQRNAAWPQPFLQDEQYAVFDTLNPMLSKGWQTHCTLNAAHFDEDNKLNKAGEAQLVTILRTSQKKQPVYVVSDANKGKTNARMQAVSSRLASWSVSMPVKLTNSNPSWMAGGYVDNYSQQFKSNAPAPMIGSVSAGDASGN